MTDEGAAVGGLLDCGDDAASESLVSFSSGVSACGSDETAVAAEAVSATGSCLGVCGLCGV